MIDDNSSSVFQLLDKVLVADEISLGTLYPNDSLHFEIQGVEIHPQFSSSL